MDRVLVKQASLFGGCVFFFDQLTKWVILEHVMAPPRIIEVTSFFNLVLVWNNGVSFGLFNTDSPYNQWVLSALAILICGGLLLWMRKETDRFVVVALACIIGGALGNVVDRLRFGAVTDFLDFHAGGYHWPAFNIADAGVVIGAMLLVFDSLFPAKK